GWNFDGRQNFFDLRTSRLQPRRKTQIVAQFFHPFVQNEARRISRDLKQHTTWLAKVDRVKVGSINYRCDVVSELDEAMPPVTLLLVIAGAKCDVMNRAGRYTPRRAIGHA